MKKIISFCLYGSQSMYIYGAVKNAKIIRERLPDFTARFYYDNSVPLFIIQTLLKAKAELVAVDWNVKNNHLMMSRFTACDDADVEYAFIRDADSRITERDISTMYSFIEQKYCYMQSIHDHPYHNLCLCGGLIAFRKGYDKYLGSTMTEIVKQHMFDYPNSKNSDQLLLKDFVYGKIRPILFVQQDYEFFYHGLKSYPISHKRQSYEFIGDVYNEIDEQLYNYQHSLKEYVEKLTK